MPDDLETRLNALAAELQAMRTRFDGLERSCTMKHVAMDRRAEDFEEELTEHDRTIDLLKAELHEHGDALKAQSEVLKWVKAWVERWGAETVSLGRTLEHLVSRDDERKMRFERLEERQISTSQMASAILEKMGLMMSSISELAGDMRKGRVDGR